MFYYTNYDKETGRIKSSGMCSNEHDVELNKREGFEQLKGICGNGQFHKVETRIDGMVPYRVVVDKTPAEIEADKRPPVPESKRPANITKGQLQQIMDRLAALEAKGE